MVKQTVANCAMSIPWEYYTQNKQISDTCNLGRIQGNYPEWKKKASLTKLPTI